MNPLRPANMGEDSSKIPAPKSPVRFVDQPPPLRHKPHFPVEYRNGRPKSRLPALRISTDMPKDNLTGHSTNFTGMHDCDGDWLQSLKSPGDIDTQLLGYASVCSVLGSPDTHIGLEDSQGVDTERPNSILMPEVNTSESKMTGNHERRSSDESLNASKQPI